jgi:hypothetical protein
MTVTTALGEAVRRRRLGEGDGCAGVGLALLGAAVFDGDGSGTRVGVAWDPDGLLARGLAVACGEAATLGDAVGFGCGLGLGVAADAAAISSTGDARAAANGSAATRRRNARTGTRRL